MARRNTAPRRYAEAAFEVATRDDTLDRWRADLDMAASLAGDQRALDVLANPAIPVERRATALAELLGDRVSSQAARISSGCCFGAAGSRTCRASPPSTGVSTTVVRASPTPPPRPRPSSPRTRSGSSPRGWSRSTGGRIALDVEVDPSLLGGLIVRVGDRLMDGSVRGRLERLRNQLISGAL